MVKCSCQTFASSKRRDATVKQDKITKLCNCRHCEACSPSEPAEPRIPEESEVNDAVERDQQQEQEQEQEQHFGQRIDQCAVNLTAEADHHQQLRGSVSHF
jgi:cell fate (sporulation/competence/biofilm development) regulator YlbF (YheA/YmcA/DUF963 family)